MKGRMKGRRRTTMRQYFWSEQEPDGSEDKLTIVGATKGGKGIEFSVVVTDGALEDLVDRCRDIVRRRRDRWVKAAQNVGVE